MSSAQASSSCQDCVEASIDPPLTSTGENRFSILATGALYRDVLVKVSSFPAEDDKLSAISETTRVGGNISNTLSVLAQVIPKDSSQLLYATVVGGAEGLWRPLISALEARGISMLYEIRQGDNYVTPTAYIFESEETGSRTIISHQLIPPLRSSELLSLLFTHFFPQNTFMSHAYDQMLSQVYNAHSSFYPSWVHFEGRECFMVDGVIDHFVSRREYKVNPCMISVEFEKYGRPGLDLLMGRCDVAFVSEVYMRDFLKEKWSATSLESDEEAVGMFVNLLRGSLKRDMTIFVTAGAKGAYLVPFCTEDAIHVVHIPAPVIAKEDLLETTGAGDTFIAAAIYGIGYKQWNSLKAGRVAVNVASRKCTQVGYDLLGSLKEGFGSLEQANSTLEGGLMSERSSVGPEARRMEGLL